ncbi:MAG: DUF2124 family protein [Syntrophorhabdaceae bacterium]|nr:DUF2124 family protein [Syntrophorhabdaceae bacterium]
MAKERRILLEGKDHNDMLSLFRSLIEISGIKEGESLIWAGCPGPCYSMATFFSCGIKDKNLNIFFAGDGDIKRLWQLEDLGDVGVTATKKVDPVQAKIIVIMSGLVHAPFGNVERLIKEGLAEGGVIIGETVIPHLFEDIRWTERIPFRYIFEFTMKEPKVIEIL